MDLTIDEILLICISCALAGQLFCCCRFCRCCCPPSCCSSKLAQSTNTDQPLTPSSNAHPTDQTTDRTNDANQSCRIVCKTGPSFHGPQSATVFVGNRAGVTSAYEKFHYKVSARYLLAKPKCSQTSKAHCARTHTLFAANEATAANNSNRKWPAWAREWRAQLGQRERLRWPSARVAFA